MRAMLRSTLSMSITAQGVPYPRAILAARGVVIKSTPVQCPRHCEPTGRANARPMTGSAKQSIYPSPVMDCFVAALLAMTAENILSLFYLFTQHFKFKPFVFSVFKFPLRFGERRRSRIELLPILRVEIGIVKDALPFGDLGLQFGDRLRQGFQRVLFVEIEPPLWRRRWRGSLRCLLVFGRNST